MTRLNLVDPELLIDQHLVSEYREIPRIFNNPPKTSRVPDRYVLGPGHVAFFRDKIDFVLERHQKLVEEMQKRGFRTSIQLEDPQSKPDWQPTKRDVMLSVQRLVEKIETMNPEPRYYGLLIFREQAIEFVKTAL